MYSNGTPAIHVTTKAPMPSFYVVGAPTMGFGQPA